MELTTKELKNQLTKAGYNVKSVKKHRKNKDWFVVACAILSNNWKEKEASGEYFLKSIERGLSIFRSTWE